MILPGLPFLPPSRGLAPSFGLGGRGGLGLRSRRWFSATPTLVRPPRTFLAFSTGRAGTTLIGFGERGSDFFPGRYRVSRIVAICYTPWDTLSLKLISNSGCSSFWFSARRIKGSTIYASKRAFSVIFYIGPC